MAHKSYKNYKSYTTTHTLWGWGG